MSLKVLHQDENLIAVYKPSGIMIHRSSLSKDKEFLMTKLRDQIGKTVYPVHRLDRPTSGIVLFALNKETAAKLSQFFRDNKIKKTYHAIVRGHTSEGIIDYPLKNELTGKIQTAITKYKTLQKFEIPVANKHHPTSRYSLVEIYPQTGRMHQIRRHFAHIRHPIIGDTKHGDGFHNRIFREKFGIKRLLLEAIEIECSELNLKLNHLLFRKIIKQETQTQPAHRYDELP